MLGVNDTRRNSWHGVLRAELTSVPTHPAVFIQLIERLVIFGRDCAAVKHFIFIVHRVRIPANCSWLFHFSDILQVASRLLVERASECVTHRSCVVDHNNALAKFLRTE